MTFFTTKKKLFSDQIKEKTGSKISQVFRLISKKEKENVSKQIFQHLNQYSNILYYLFTQFVLLLSQLNEPFINNLCKTYFKQLKINYSKFIFKQQPAFFDITFNQEKNKGQKNQKLSIQYRKKISQLEMLFKNQLYFIDKNMTPQINYQPIFFQQIFKITKNKNGNNSESKNHLLVLVHGLQATRYDFQSFKICLLFMYPNHTVLISSSNQNKTQGDIEEMGQRLANQVKFYLSQFYKVKKFRLSFIGHSMGGIIIRAAIPHLQKYFENLYLYMSLSSPHLGYMYNTSRLIQAGLWYLNKMQKCFSISQLSMKDKENMQQTFLYKLSLKKSLNNFKKIVLFGSYQDRYVPFESARIQKCQSAINDKNIKKIQGKLYCKMVNNILKSIKAESLHRIDINLNIPEMYFLVISNLDTFIGRTAHIKFLTEKPLLRIITHVFTDLLQ